MLGFIKSLAKLTVYQLCEFTVNSGRNYLCQADEVEADSNRTSIDFAQRDNAEKIIFWITFF